MKSYSLLAGLAVAMGLVAATASAQTFSSITAKILDENKKPLADVQVSLEVDGPSTVKPILVKTNKKGDFLYDRIVPGKYKLTFTKEGYNLMTGSLELGKQPKDLGEIPMNPKGPADAGAFQKGVEAANAGRIEEAEAMFKEMMAKVPDNPLIYFNLAWVYGKKGDWANAEAGYKKVLELDPAMIDAYKGLGNIYQQQRRTDDAIALFTTAVAAHPDNGYLLYELGLFQREKGQHAEAHDTLVKAVTLLPDNPEVHYHLATTAINLGKNDEALSELEKYLAMNPQNAENVESAKSLIPYLKPTADSGKK